MWKRSRGERRETRGEPHRDFQSSPYFPLASHLSSLVSRLYPQIYLTHSKVYRTSYNDAVTHKNVAAATRIHERAKPPRGGADRATAVGSSAKWRQSLLLGPITPMRVMRKAPGPVCYRIEGVAERMLADIPIVCSSLIGTRLRLAYRSCSEFLSRTRRAFSSRWFRLPGVCRSGCLSASRSAPMRGVTERHGAERRRRKRLCGPGSEEGLAFYCRAGTSGRNVRRPVPDVSCGRTAWRRVRPIVLGTLRKETDHDRFVQRFPSIGRP